MYETKLANSIQMDYRQAADNYRVAQSVAPKAQATVPVKAIAITALITLSILVMALQPAVSYACGIGGGGGC